MKRSASSRYSIMALSAALACGAAMTVGGQQGTNPGPFTAAQVDAGRTAYAANLMSSRYRSANTRYSQLIEDIRNDVTRLPAFFEAAARVLDIDAKRRQALGHIREMSPFERENAGKRMAENAAIVAMVRGSLERRVGSYQFALERLVIVTPSPQAVEAERLLGQLKGKMAFYRKWAPTGRGDRVAFDY